MLQIERRSDVEVEGNKHTTSTIYKQNGIPVFFS